MSKNHRGSGIRSLPAHGRGTCAICKKENNKIKSEYRKLRSNIEASEEVSGRASVSNVDLLRRLSNLEKIVYKD